jgi:hypothetical protein
MKTARERSPRNRPATRARRVLSGLSSPEDVCVESFLFLCGLALPPKSLWPRPGRWPALCSVTATAVAPWGWCATLQRSDVGSDLPRAKNFADLGMPVRPPHWG